jgi:hypothetical protein
MSGPEEVAESVQLLQNDARPNGKAWAGVRHRAETGGAGGNVKDVLAARRG